MFFNYVLEDVDIKVNNTVDVYWNFIQCFDNQCKSFIKRGTGRSVHTKDDHRYPRQDFTLIAAIFQNMIFERIT